jgi:hypothetical protein
MNLAEFLLARVAEDEAVARAAGTGWAGPEPMGAIEGGDSVFVSPARVLAECEAKRSVLALHRSGDAWCDYCSHSVVDDRCPTIRALAAVFRDHPDFDPAWSVT